jgi:hypothetical protein
MLAYNWDNMLLACEVCNSGNKKDQFPIVNGSQPKENRRSPCSQNDTDANALINPCVDDPEEFFIFSDEWVVCLDHQRALITRTVLGLNREALVDSRKEQLIRVKVAAQALKMAQENHNEAALKRFAYQIKSMISPSAPYIAMTRSKLKDLGIDVEYLLSLPE